MQVENAFAGDAFSVAVLNELPDMARVIDRHGQEIYRNSAMSMRLNSQAPGKCEKIPGASVKCEECVVEKCIEMGQRVKIVSRVMGRVYSVVASPVTYHGEIYALEILRDITQEQNLKDRLMQSNTRMMKDLEIARSLQLSILRHNLPNIGGYRFSAEFLPCDALGGDMYDCFRARDGRVFMYIADVSGHGVMPAMLTVYLRQEMFAQCKNFWVSPDEVLENIQISFEDLNTEESIYITVFVLALDPNTGEFVYANAGHSVPPLIAGEDGVRELFMPGAPICRWVDTPQFSKAQGMLAPGEKLLLYTDGLDGIHTGEESNQKLCEILGDDAFGGEALLGEIKKQFTQTKADDVTMLLCERTSG